MDGRRIASVRVEKRAPEPLDEDANSAIVTDTTLYLIKAFILGIVEGSTEFIPVSSTGHSILIGDWINFESSQGKVFEVVIQSGSISAVMWIFRARSSQSIRGTSTGVASEVAFTRNSSIAFSPTYAMAGPIAPASSCSSRFGQGFGLGGEWGGA
ncbi:hypothetical protein OY671_010610, partial [Metschnikowia pulcherrima]